MIINHLQSQSHTKKNLFKYKIKQENIFFIDKGEST